MGDPHVVAGQLAATRIEGPEAEVARLRQERDRLAARVRELEYTLAACKNLGTAADSAAVALLRRAVTFLKAIHDYRNGRSCGCGACRERDAILADARSFLEASRG